LIRQKEFFQEITNCCSKR